MRISAAASLAAALGLALGLAGGAAQAASPAEDQARGWLAAVDRGDWGGAYANAGTLLRSHITAQQWSILGGATRTPLGAVVSRDLVSSQESTTLPGAPDGHYVVLRFHSRFAHKADALETVALAREGSAWRVDGYYIK